ncbi:MAG: hypothetical protein AABX90_01710, partial [Nanoarchaeota archaeon]
MGASFSEDTAVFAMPAPFVESGFFEGNENEFIFTTSNDNRGTSNSLIVNNIEIGTDDNGDQFPLAPWHAMNNNMPIDIDNGAQSLFSLKTFALATQDKLYYFFNSERFGVVIGRLDLPNGIWEILTETGWRSNANDIPMPLSLTEKIMDLEAFEVNGDIFGLYRGVSQVLPTSLDVHGAIFNFIMRGNRITKWAGGTSYDELAARTLISSWNGIQGDIAVDNAGNAVVVGTFGYTLGDVPIRLTAAKYFPNDAQSIWKIWSGNSWNNWNGNFNTYTTIPHPNMPQSMTVLSPKIVYIENTQEYIVLFYESDSRSVCAGLYKDSELAWKW